MSDQKIIYDLPLLNNELRANPGVWLRYTALVKWDRDGKTDVIERVEPDLPEEKGIDDAR